MVFIKRFFRKIRTKEEINNEISKFEKKFGKLKEIEKLKESFELDELREKFFHNLFLLGYERNKNKKKKLLDEAKDIAKKVPELKGWPENAVKFWDTEAFRWQAAIPLKVRTLIKDELSKRIKKGLNLSLGSGNYPYIENSILIDYSKEMLKIVRKAKKKIVYDINKKLPFNSNHFDSVTAVFIVDYLKDLKKVLKDVKRVLKKNGKLVIVNSKNQINELYHMQEKKTWKAIELKNILVSLGFKVKIDTKKIDNKELFFIEAVK